MAKKQIANFTKN